MTQRNIQVVAVGAPGLAAALSATGRFAHVHGPNRLAELREMIANGLLSGLRQDDLVFIFADNIAPDESGASLDSLLSKLTGAGWRVCLLELVARARDLVRANPGAGIVPVAGATTNSVLGALSGMGMGLIEPVAEQWAYAPLDMMNGPQQPPAPQPTAPAAPVAPAAPAVTGDDPWAAQMPGDDPWAQHAARTAEQTAPDAPAAAPAWDQTAWGQTPAAPAAPAAPVEPAAPAWDQTGWGQPAPDAGPAPAAPAWDQPAAPPPADPASWGQTPAAPAAPAWDASSWGEAPAAPAEPSPPADSWGATGWGEAAAPPAEQPAWDNEPAPAPAAEPAWDQTSWGQAPAAPAEPAAPAWDASSWGEPAAEPAAQPAAPAWDQTSWGQTPAQPDAPAAQPTWDQNGWGQTPAEQDQPAADPADGWGSAGWGEPAAEPAAQPGWQDGWQPTPEPEAPQQTWDSGGWGAPPATQDTWADPTAAPAALGGAYPVSNRPARRGFAAAVTVAKGGAGKSSLTLNLGVYLGLRLREAKRTVCIVDANIQQPDIGKMISAYSPNIMNLVRAQEDITVDRIERHLHHRPDLNCSFLLGPHSVADANPLWLTPELYNHVLEVLRQLYDYVIVDTPVAEYNHELFSQFVLPSSDFLVVPVNPNFPTLVNADEWLRAITQPRLAGGAGYDEHRVGIVLNRAEEGVACSEEEVMAELANWQYLGAIPESREWKRAANEEEMVATRNYTELNAAFARILYAVTGEEVLLAGQQAQGPAKRRGGLRLFKRGK